MDEKTNNKPHWSFWGIGALTLVWNSLGFVNFLVQMNPDTVATFPESHQAIINGRPLWASAGFAVGVFVGALGCALLLLRKLAANYLFIISLVGIIVTMLHTIRVGTSVVEFTVAEVVVMIVMPVIVAAFLVWYGRWSEKQGWLR